MDVVDIVTANLCSRIGEYADLNLPILPLRDGFALRAHQT